VSEAVSRLAWLVGDRRHLAALVYIIRQERARTSHRKLGRRAQVPERCIPDTLGLVHASTWPHPRAL
jgi:hypothetical protein